ncbi:hypothetical protein L227DRAFT_584613 [Lentinus tigrinus ALCF2SS1-6]|uniref:Uncharacterized protein n=1 Tax=Lentinus tigrinus ALCF2SS1-6 TaxID=1328759 RepID=A0A5C2SJY8_9APHY|nr:hypothetical protein L227DRAFT_584613 [Lentinus tigrinus ALCF2SS1-6]
MVPTSLAGLPKQIRPRRPPARATAPVPTISSGSDLPPAALADPPPPPPMPIETSHNHFRVFRRYFGSLPSRDPEESLTLDSFTDTWTHTRPLPDEHDRDPLRPFGSQTAQDENAMSFAPFANISIFRCMRWLYTGSNRKTPGELNCLVREVFMAPEYQREHLVRFDANHENKRLDEHTATAGAFAAEDGWRNASVFIRLPKEGHQYASETDAPLFKIKNIFIRPFSEIQKKAATDREPGDAEDIEYVVAPVQIYSDSTHLANFGTASLWPIYLFFGSLSKYIRSRPNAFATHHLAYIVSLPATIQRVYQETYGVPASEAVLRFCKRELMNQIWHLLLDADFVQAYVHGILIECDKVVDMGMVRDMSAQGKNLRMDSHQVQYDIRAARQQIFERGAAPEGAAVEGILKSKSLTPVWSAFSEKLGPYGHDVYQMLMPDVMHEFELGVWKAVFMHLVRILIAAGGDRVQRLDMRFSRMPTFGRDTIRRFGSNISAMKKLAARDFENILQCAYFAFDGLLADLDPTYDRLIMKLLFVLATWHALAKLRLHSDPTLTFFEQLTQILGAVMRAFVRQVCSAYMTKELPSETLARQRRSAAKANARNAVPTELQAAKGPKIKHLNLKTYKYHRLGDYPGSIREHGTMDNTTTQPGELEHRCVKGFYAHTNKNTGFSWQIARHQRCQQYLNTQGGEPASHRANLRETRSRKKSRRARAVPACLPLHLPFEASEPLTPTSAKEHTQISEEQAYPINLASYLTDNHDDPSFHNFAAQLETHVFHCLEALAGRPTTPREPTPVELDAIRIDRGRLFLHKVMRVNYTSYDMRREQDSINPRTHPDIMMVAPPGSPHPYLYARVISIFHVNAYRVDPGDFEPPEKELLHVLWVRWYDFDTKLPSGFQHFRPHRLTLAALADEVFGFVSPDQVLRGVHIIPAERFGHSEAPSLPYRPFTGVPAPDSDVRTQAFDGAASGIPEVRKDNWKYYYISMWSDRDLFMRFLGGGIGHQESLHRLPPHSSDSDSAVDPTDFSADSGSMNTRHGIEDSQSDDEEPDDGYIASDLEDEGEQQPADSWEDADKEPDLGPEDGEGDDEMDEYEATNYASY